MPNMKHCRFENTLVDMRDCLDALEESELQGSEIVNENGNKYSESETRAMSEMLETMKDITDEMERLKIS